MAYGINFNNNTGARVLDGKHLIPQKITTLDCRNYQYFEGTATDGTGCHPGYRLREWFFNPSSSLYNRPHLIFWEFPDTQGNDIWMNGGSVFSLKVMYGTNVNPSLINPPKGHVFALDYVSQSSATNGMRVWNPDNGTLIYDSGNYHLSIWEMFNIGVNTILDQDVPRSTIMSYDSPHYYFPWDLSNGQPGGISGPAFSLPNRFGAVDYANRFGTAWRWEYEFFYRIHGATLDTRAMRTSFSSMGDDPSNISWRYAPYVSGGNLSVQNIFGGDYR